MLYIRLIYIRFQEITIYKIVYLYILLCCFLFLTDYISYWLGSIHIYGSMSAPVILVALHSGSTEAEKDRTVSV